MIQSLTQNIVDLESYSLLFRPLSDSTDIIQFSRYTYSEENVKLVKSLIQDHIEIEQAESWSAVASLLFIYLLRSEQLTMQVFTDQSNTPYCCVCDSESSVVFDVVSVKSLSRIQSNRTKNLDHRGDSPLSDPVTIEKAFDLLTKVQPKAKRYQIDEIITVENQENSGFLNNKKAMDYLYHLGVFGTFR